VTARRRVRRTPQKVSRRHASAAAAAAAAPRFSPWAVDLSCQGGSMEAALASGRPLCCEPTLGYTGLPSSYKTQLHLFFFFPAQAAICARSAAQLYLFFQF